MKSPFAFDKVLTMEDPVYAWWLKTCDFSDERCPHARCHRGGRSGESLLKHKLIVSK